MFRTHRSRRLAVSGLALAFAAVFNASAAAADAGVQTVRPAHIGIILPPAPPPMQNILPPDSGLATTYSFYSGTGYVSWSVCGSVIGSEGCYAGGNMGPFTHAGALIEGNETVSGNTVTRNIYVVDDGVRALVLLYIYKQTVVVTPPYAEITVAPVTTLGLYLVGGTGVVSYIAGNDHALFIGTNLSETAVKVEKDTLAVSNVGGFSPPLKVSSITANKYGYVTVNFGGNHGFTGFYAYDNFGNLFEDGGGNELVAGNRNGISVGTLQANGASQLSAARMQIHMTTSNRKP